MHFHSVQLTIPDVILITLARYADARGHFMETYRASSFEEFGRECPDRC